MSATIQVNQRKPVSLLIKECADTYKSMSLLNKECTEHWNMVSNQALIAQLRYRPLRLFTYVHARDAELQLMSFLKPSGHDQLHHVLGRRVVMSTKHDKAL